MHPAYVTAEIPLPDEAATQAAGAALAGAIRPGLVIRLDGDLGAGKTTLARALIRALGHTGPVKSPTYALVEVYVVSSLYLYHFDFYRFESPEEFLEAGFAEYFNADSVCLVEWPEKAGDCLPAADLRLALRHAGDGRILQASAGSAEGERCVSTLVSALGGAASCAPPAPH